MPLNNEKISIYAKFYKANDIDKKPYKDSIQNLFPNKGSDYIQESENNYIFLNYRNSKIDKSDDVYILLTIYSNQKNRRIKLITSGIESTRTLLPYNTEKLINFKEKISFYLPSDFKEKLEENYLVNIRTIKGAQKLIIDDNEIYKELNGSYYIEVESYPYSKAFDIDYIENKEQKDQGLLITFEKSKKDKLYKIEKDIINEVYLKGNNYFPNHVYIPLEFNISMDLEYSFYDINYNNQKGNDNFKITGMIITKSELDKRKKNPEEKLEGEIIIGNYSLSEKRGNFSLNKEKIKNDNEYYLFITIDKESDNENEYESLKVKFTSLKIGEGEKKEEKEKKEPKIVELPNLILIISFFIAIVLLIIPIVVYICAKIKRKRSMITIDHNDVNESISIRDDSLLPNKTIN